MKFGFRTPTLRKRIAARTSPARAVRHRLGLKAPAGLGWLTSPRKAMYNRLYGRTSVDATKGSGLGSVVVFAVIVAVVTYVIVH